MFLSLGESNFVSSVESAGLAEFLHFLCIFMLGHLPLSFFLAHLQVECLSCFLDVQQNRWFWDQFSVENVPSSASVVEESTRSRAVLEKRQLLSKYLTRTWKSLVRERAVEKTRLSRLDFLFCQLLRILLVLQSRCRMDIFSVSASSSSAALGSLQEMEEFFEACVFPTASRRVGELAICLLLLLPPTFIVAAKVGVWFQLVLKLPSPCFFPKKLRMLQPAFFRFSSDLSPIEPDSEVFAGY